MKPHRVLGIVSLLACVACGQSESTADPPQRWRPPQPVPPPPAQPIDASAIPGTWTGAPCGDRPWVRTLQLQSDGRYTGHDPVSPCPQGAECVWSGIVDFEGRWTLTDGTTITLTETPGAGAQSVQRPPRLTHAQGALFGPEGCRYERRR